MSTKSYTKTPQAMDDVLTGLDEDFAGVRTWNVMDNDLGGSAKVLWSVDNGDLTTDLLIQDGATIDCSGTNASANGARIWITTDGTIGYDAYTLSDEFRAALQALGEGQTLSDTFTYSIRLANGTISIATAHVVYSGVNDAPEAAAVTLAAIAEDSGARIITAAELLAGASDVDSSDLTITSLTIASGNGVLVDNGNGTWTYTPAADDDTSVTFNYTVSDGSLSDSSTATLDITPVNDAPVAAATAELTIDEDNPSAATAIGATDVDGDTLTYSVKAGSEPANGEVTFDQEAGTFVYTPDENYHGTDSFTILIDDGNCGTAEQVVSVTITPVNDAPALTGTQAELAGGTEDEPYTVTLADLLEGYTDADSDVLRVLNVQADHGTVTDNGDGTFTVYPDADHNGAVVLTYAVSDGTAETSATISFELAPVEDSVETRVNDAANDKDFDDPASVAHFNGISANASSTIHGTTGVDRIVGVDNPDGTTQTIYGDNNIDYIHGAGGRDIIYGDAQGDFLYGGAGNDEIFGGGQTDEIYGGSGNDTITGDGQADTIYGGSGNDTIRGGGAGDSLWGGTGADTFVFVGSESALGSRDTINDFSHAEGDLIDVSALGFAASDWAGNIGTQGALGAGQIGYVVNLDGSLTIFGDTGTDGTAEFSVTVFGVGSLQSGDFLFGTA